MININCNGVFDVKEGVSVQESLGPVNPNLENQDVQAVQQWWWKGPVSASLRKKLVVEDILHQDRQASAFA